MIKSAFACLMCLQLMACLEPLQGSTTSDTVSDDTALHECYVCTPHYVPNPEINPDEVCQEVHDACCWHDVSGVECVSGDDGGPCICPPTTITENVSVQCAGDVVDNRCLHGSRDQPCRPSILTCEQ